MNSWQTVPEGETEDTGGFWRWTQLPWLDRRRLDFYPRALFVAFLAAIVAWTARTVANGMIDPMGRAIGCDFVQYWSAARAVLEGSSAAVYDFRAFQAFENMAVGAIVPEFPWHYPPPLLLLVTPLGLLPYLGALVLWYASGLAAFVALLSRIARSRTELWIGLAFPATLIAIAYGQIDLLLAGAFGFGLLLLDTRPLAAGALFALVALKPQLAPLLPVALLVSGRWRAFGAAAMCLAALIAASWLAFGTATWQAYLDDISELRQLYEHWQIPWYRVPSFFVTTRLLGGGLALAYLVQIVAALAGLVSVIWAWRGRGRPDLQAAVLVVADALVSPYLFDYDLVLLVLAMAWLGQHAVERGWLRGEKPALVAIWLGPFLSLLSAVLLHVHVEPLLVAVFLGLACRRLARERHAVEAVE